MVRTQVIRLRKGTKEVTIIESTVGELEELLGPEAITNVDKLIGSNTAGDAKSAIFNLIYEKIPEFIPDVTAEDIKKSYMSELEDLIQAYINVNFLAVKRLAGPLLKTMLSAGSQIQP